MNRRLRIVNGSAFRNEEIVPLLNFAWDYAWKTAPAGNTPIKQHPAYNKLYTDEARNKFCVWEARLVKSKFLRAGMAYVDKAYVRIRLGDPAKLKVKWPVKETYPRFNDMPEYEIRSWREMIVMIAAHEFAHLTGYSGSRSGEEMCELTAWDAVESYRRSQDIVDAKIARLCENVDKKNQKSKEPESTDSKLAKLDAKEKVWRRKLALATTKLRKIKRSRSMIVAARKRRLAHPPELSSIPAQ